MAQYSTFTLPDGANLAYEIQGAEHIGHVEPLVLIGGMSSRRIDWERLAPVLAEKRPILLFDHRGIGDSTYSTPTRDDEISIESLARDLVFLLEYLQWKEIVVCGYSMGGAIAQRLIFLPFHPQQPTPLPFKVTHLLLTATYAKIPSDLDMAGYGLKLPQLPPGEITDAEKKEILRPGVEAFFDKHWLEDKANAQRRQWWVDQNIIKRPRDTIEKQKLASRSNDFGDLYDLFPREIQVLVIHGELDRVLPFTGGQKILEFIPWAKMVQIGDRPGTVPNYQFGHAWFEYFIVEVWKDVVEVFLQEDGGN